MHWVLIIMINFVVENGYFPKIKKSKLKQNTNVTIYFIR